MRDTHRQHHNLLGRQQLGRADDPGFASGSKPDEQISSPEPDEQIKLLGTFVSVLVSVNTQAAAEQQRSTEHLLGNRPPLLTGPTTPTHPLNRLYTPPTSMVEQDFDRKFGPFEDRPSILAAFTAGQSVKSTI